MQPARSRSFQVPEGCIQCSNHDSIFRISRYFRSELPRHERAHFSYGAAADQCSICGIIAAADKASRDVPHKRRPGAALSQFSNSKLKDALPFTNAGLRVGANAWHCQPSCTKARFFERAGRPGGITRTVMLRSDRGWRPSARGNSRRRCRQLRKTKSRRRRPRTRSERASLRQSRSSRKTPRQ